MNLMKNSKIINKVSLIITALVISASLIIPIKVQAAAATQVFSPVADSYVTSGAPDKNYGSNTSLRVDNSPELRSYLRFNVTEMDTGQSYSAKLRMYANSSNSTGFSVKLVDDNNWIEKSITYNNSPAMGDELVKSQKISKATWVEVDVTSLITRNATYNIALTTNSNTNTNFASREAGSKAPQLVISYGNSPSSTPTPLPLPTEIPTEFPTIVPTSEPTTLPTQFPTSIPTENPSLTTTPTQNPTQIVSPTNTPTQSVSPTSVPTSTPGNDVQPTFPIRAAFYYPWFPEAWTQLGLYPYTNYTPDLGYYNESDQSLVKKHIEMMQYGNIQAGIASWWGQSSRTDNRINGLLSAASGSQFRWSVYYENESLTDPSVTQIQSDLNYLATKYGNDPSYLRVNRKFVVFVYADANDGCGMADRWKAGNTAGAYVVLKVFAGYRNCASQPDGWHQYSPAVATDQQGTESFAISPGFWLKGQPVRLARDLTRFTQNVKSMVSANTKWQLITTFNEWGEGTIVEPAAEWSTSSKYGAYLDALHFNGNPPGGCANPDHKSDQHTYGYSNYSTH